jgi:WD40 repeat protein
MLRRLALAVVIGAGILAVVVCKAGLFRASATVQPTDAGPRNAEPVPTTDFIGDPLYPPCFMVPAGPAQLPRGADPVVIPDCRLTVIDKQDVPSQRDGELLFIGTEVDPGQSIPTDQLFTARVGGKEQQFRRLKEGDAIRPGQLLAYLDDQLSRDEWDIKNAKVTSSRADLEAAIKTRDESKNRYDTQVWLQQHGRGATSQEDLRAAKLAWERAACEAISKEAAVTLAERERSQVETILRMHQLRSTTAGVLKAILKRPGEAVKALEPVFQIQNLGRLRVEGLVDVPHLPRLHTGMRACAEAVLPVSPEQTLVGHVDSVTAVAVNQNAGRSMIVSASEDGTVRVWDRAAPRERCILHHPAAVVAVACTPPGAEVNLCLSGAADGIGRLWELDGTQDAPLRELKGGHAGAITSVAFSPNGRACATGGEDHAICLWDTTSGTLRYRFPDGHRGTVTALTFTPRAELVSAGRDNTLRLWTLGQRGARLKSTFDHRLGHVTQPGVRPDGRHVIYDQGGTLRLLSLPEGLNEGVVERASGAGNFTTFALFSPEARLILTAAEDRVQLWRAPAAARRAGELVQFVATEPTGATCAAWAPDGSFVVVGGSDQQVRVWPVPPAPECERRLTAEVTLLERAVETSTRQVRIWAELPNPDGRLLPGTTVTLVLDDGER